MSTAELPVAAAGTIEGTGQAAEADPLAKALLPLAVDVAVPLGVYYAAREFGIGLVPALIASSVVPAVRTVWSLLRTRSLNAFATLMLAVNAVGLVTAFLTGDPRLMIAKDGLTSSAIGIGILISVRRGRPMMSAGLRPFISKGRADRDAAWAELSTGSAAFRRAERGYSLIWGSALVLECLSRVVGAYTLPLATMAWLPTVLLVGAIGLAIVISGPYTQRMERLIAARTGTGNTYGNTDGE